MNVISQGGLCEDVDGASTRSCEDAARHCFHVFLSNTPRAPHRVPR